MPATVEHPCLAFCRIDASDPVEVGAFMYWLYFARWPHEELPRLDTPLTKRDPLPPELLIEEIWGEQAPRNRMVRLMWQLLQDNTDDLYFQSRFTSSWKALAEDAETCARILPPVQERIKWVLTSYQSRREEDLTIGQGAWGEEWWLPALQAAYIRQQLRRAQPDLLEQPSDYQEALALQLLSIKKYRIGGVDVPSTDVERVYVGHRRTLPSGDVRAQVFVEVGVQEFPLMDAASLLPGVDFEWGYAGSGPNLLAASILADATGGNLLVAEQLKVSFRDAYLNSLPRWEDFRIPWREVAIWLESQGLDSTRLSELRERIEERRRESQSAVNDLEDRLARIDALPGGHLVHQRFDLVPPDFECALCIDLVQMLQQGGFALRCSGCGLPFGGGSTERRNRQRGRMLSGRPVYCADCSRDRERIRKQGYYHRLSTDPNFRERERKRVQQYREETRNS